MTNFKDGDLVVINMTQKELDNYHMWWLIFLNRKKYLRKPKLNKIYVIRRVANNSHVYLKHLQYGISIEHVQLYNPVENILQGILDE